MAGTNDALYVVKGAASPAAPQLESCDPFLPTQGMEYNPHYAVLAFPSVRW